MWRLGKSICGCDFRTAAILGVIFYALSNLILVLGCIIILNDDKARYDFDLNEVPDDAIKLQIVICLFCFLLLIAVLVGLIKRITLAALALLIYIPIFALLNYTAVILTIVLHGFDIGNVFYLCFIVIDVYLALLVYNYWMELKEGKNSK